MLPTHRDVDSGMRLHGLIIPVAFCVGCGGKTELYVPNAAATSDSGVTEASPSYPSGALATYGLGAGILIYPPHPSGSTAPLTHLAGDWQQDACEGLAFDLFGNLYATCYQAGPSEPAGRVLVFASGSTGNAQPTRAIVRPANVASDLIVASAVDHEGWLYVVRDDSSGAVFVYPPDANGDSPPARTITGPDTGLWYSASGAIGPQDELYVGSAEGTPILVFGNGADGNVTPIRRIGSFGDVDDAVGVAVDSAGNVYVADAVGAVVVYDSTATNTPSRIIKGPATGMQDVFSIAVDSDGRIYVSNFDSVAVFSPGASGNVGPEAVLSNAGGRGVAIAP
jgi:hypothetical protein